MKYPLALVSLIIGLLVFVSLHAFAQDSLYISKDFTKPNLFSFNIEGPAFDKNGNLFVVNFEKDGTIGLVKPNGQAELFLTLPAGSTANSIQFDQAGSMFLADYTGHQVLRVDMKTKTVKVYAHALFNQPNDLCINKKGQLFASDPNWKEGTGKLWRIDNGGKTILLLDNLGTTNGIALSPDEKTLYVNESVQRNIWSFQVDKNGKLSNKKLLIRFDDFGFDGMKCDKMGNLYATRYGKGTVVVISPEGKIIREIKLLGQNCSNLVFGGSDGKTVFVTMQDRKGIEMFRNDIAGKGY
ncbi:MAG: SMP-30/gluconolactonase/LRE family protein [Cyclobacteriaceae bacterium]|jgi:gluconolactonase|nr:SMP-30/gluconolactonase/LRE family protein [Flammeovirgaceae bacterium]